VLVDETRRVIDLVVDNDEEIFFRSVLRDVRVGVFLVGHCGRGCEGDQFAMALEEGGKDSGRPGQAKRGCNEEEGQVEASSYEQVKCTDSRAEPSVKDCRLC
jgi:hypothetical protein